MGFAWQPRKGGARFSGLYRDDDDVGLGYYRRGAAWTALRSPAGRHALSRGQRGAHASRLADVPLRANWRSGPEQWRRWA